MTSWPPSVWWALPLIVALGYGFLSWLAGRASHDRGLRRVLLGSYMLRVFLAVALYAISSWGWPIFQSLRTPNELWRFGLDSLHYHKLGVMATEVWKKGLLEVPSAGATGFEYFIIVGMMYWFLGPCPLYPILLNCLLAASSGLLAYAISRTFLARRAALTSAVLVSYWPSSLLWSTQLMKESLSWFLLFAALWLLVSAIQTNGILPAPHRQRWGVRYILLGGAVVLMKRLRPYLGAALLLTTLVIFVPLAVKAFLRRQMSHVARYAVLLLVVVFSTLSAQMPAMSNFLSKLGSSLHSATPRQPSPAVAPVAPSLGDATLEQRKGTELVQEHGSKLVDQIVSQMTAQAHSFVSALSPGSLEGMRQGYVFGGGNAVIDAKAHLSNPRALITYLPRALVIGVLAPFPRQWFHPWQSAGAASPLVGIEMCLIYLLLPVIVCGLWDAVRWRRTEGILIITFVCLLGCFLSLVVANLGTLFRLRLLFLLPLLIIAAEGDPIGVYRRMWVWVMKMMDQQDAGS